MISVVSGFEVLIDDEDAWILDERPCYVHKAEHTNYVICPVRVGGKRVRERLHRIILGASHDELVDHVNGNGLDNRRSNIRLCTPLQNAQNRRIHKSNTTGSCGVTHYTRNKTNPWRACINYLGKQIHIGYFKTMDEASTAYRLKSLELFSDFSKASVL